MAVVQTTTFMVMAVTIIYWVAVATIESAAAMVTTVSKVEVVLTIYGVMGVTISLLEAQGSTI